MATKRLITDDINYLRKGEALKREWNSLCEQYLPVSHDGSIWRYSRAISSRDPQQGWKIHISATILSATKILKRVAPILSESKVLFKAARSLDELSRLNCGLFYGFSQVGKIITVYPQSEKKALQLASLLHKLTRGMAAPAIPYDCSLAPGSCIYYRYGAFKNLEVENADGQRLPAIENPDGELVPDLREPGTAVPAWASDPFQAGARRRRAGFHKNSHLSTTIRAYEALSQRGKGGVYRALDLTNSPARLCILKEGRKHGETDWAGRDGYWRMEHETRVLNSLSSAGVKVPAVYTTFLAGKNYYLVTEFIEGENLNLHINKRKKIPVSTALDYARQLASLMAAIHSAGWVWRDCKPLNLILTNDGQLRPVDFEGACLVDSSDLLPWGTSGYAPPESLKKPRGESRLSEDLYAMGATMHHILSGQVPGSTSPLTLIGRLRKRVPQEVRRIISALLDPAPRSRPDAVTVSSEMEPFRMS